MFRIRAIFKQPGTSSLRDMYLSTLSTSLWITLIISWIILSATFYIFLHFEIHYLNLKDNAFGDLYDFFVIVAGVVSEQGKFNNRFIQNSTIVLTMTVFYSNIQVGTKKLHYSPHKSSFLYHLLLVSLSWNHFEQQLFPNWHLIVQQFRILMNC